MDPESDTARIKEISSESDNSTTIKFSVRLRDFPALLADAQFLLLASYENEISDLIWEMKKQAAVSVTGGFSETLVEKQDRIETLVVEVLERISKSNTSSIIN